MQDKVHENLNHEVTIIGSGSNPKLKDMVSVLGVMAAATGISIDQLMPKVRPTRKQSIDEVKMDLAGEKRLYKQKKRLQAAALRNSKAMKKLT